MSICAKKIVELGPVKRELDACHNMWEIAAKLLEARRLAEKYRNESYEWRYTDASGCVKSHEIEPEDLLPWEVEK